MIKVVIAEDDFRIAQIHEEFLAKNEQLTLVGKAMNAKETLTILDKQYVDLLLLDVYMPDQLGTELLHKIRSDYPSVDIIMITAAKDKVFFRKGTPVWCRTLFDQTGDNGEIPRSNHVLSSEKSDA